MGLNKFIHKKTHGGNLGFLCSLKMSGLRVIPFAWPGEVDRVGGPEVAELTMCWSR